MRRLLIVCAVAAMAASVFSVLALGQRISDSRAVEPAASTSQSATSLPIAGNGHAPVVLASGAAFRSVALDAHANLYVTNAGAPNRIFTLTGIAKLSSASASNPLASANLALVAGNGSAGSLGDGGAASTAQFNMQLDSVLFRSGIAIAPDGAMLVADTLNSTIRRIAGSDSSEPGVVRSIAGKWGPRQEIALSEPLGIALDDAGNLYVADRSAGVVDVLPSAAESSVNSKLTILAHVASPSSLALSVDGTKVFVASTETGAIAEIDTQTHAIRPVPGFPASSNSRQQGSPCAQQTAAPTSAAMCPAGVALDGGGNLFVADANSGRILRVDSQSQQITSVASNLKSPGDMNFDSSGNLYVAEQGANRLLKFVAMGDPAGNLTITPPAALPPPPAPRVCPQAPSGSYNFCDQPTGGATPTQAFTLTATTAVTGLTISFVGASPGDFQAVSNNCGTSLAANTPCQINVDFAPSAAGARAASLSVTDSAGDSATPVSLYGTGDDYQITLNGTNQEQSIFQGGAITYNFNVTPDAVFGGVVTIVCPASSQLPSLTTCTSNPATVTVTPGTAAPFTITFATTYDGVTGTTSGASLPTLPFSPNKPSGPASRLWILASALIAWFGLIRFLLAHSGKKPRWSLGAASASLVLLIATAALSLSSCKKSAIQAGLNTPVGISNLTIQGSAQNAARGNTIILDVVPH